MEDSMEKTFSLGFIVITPKSSRVLDSDAIKEALTRHQNCDWGEVFNKEINDNAVQNCGQLFSKYRDSNDKLFWVITEMGHDVTTVMYPEEF